MAEYIDREAEMNVREKLVELIGRVQQMGVIYRENQMDERYPTIEQIRNTEVAARLIANGVTVQEWISVKERLPEKDGQYLIFTTQYFTPDHIDEIDHKDGIEISGYCKRYGFLSKNGIHAKYWRYIPKPPKGE